jgi:hypothetical protein
MMLITPPQAMNELVSALHLARQMGQKYVGYNAVWIFQHCLQTG